MESTSIVRLVQNADNIFKEFSKEINKIITNEKQKAEINEYTNYYIEMCTLFDSLFSLPRLLCGNMTKKMIDKLEIVIQNTLSCWTYLRLSTKMVEIHGIEDHLLNKIIEFNGIECSIEYFIKE